MKNAIVCLIGLVFVVSVSAEPLLEGRVRLESGEPVADAQVRLFDLTDLRQGAIARAQTDGTGYFALPLAALRGSALPEGFALGSNYPNPFNPSTIIPYQLAASAAVRLEVFNLLGQRIATLVDGARPAGFHTATWHATDAAGRAVGAGVYIYRMTVGAASQTGRMVLIDGQAGVAAVGAASVWSGASGVGGSDGAGEQAYGLIVSGEGLVPYVDSSFRVEAGMTPVELVVSAGPHQAGKVTDLFDALNDAEEEEEAGPSGKAQATLEAPPEPTNLRFEAVTDSSCTVRWDAAEGATDYDVNYKRAVGGTWTNEPHKGIRLYNTIYDLEPNTEYRWAARAENSDGPSEWVFGPNFTTLPEEEEDEAMEEEEEEMQEEEMQEEEEGEAPEEVADDTPVTIPDANLRAAIAAALGKASGATITVAEMKALTTLETENAGISDLTGLEFATNLSVLYLSDNQITDLSALAGLTKLEVLGLSGNQIRDISALSGLTNLWWLGLTGYDGNQIRDISALSGLTNLRVLYLSGNQITDVSALSGLTGLTWLSLSSNQITDVSALSGLTNLTGLDLDNNPLNASSINDHIPALQARGVTVEFDPTPVTITDDPTPVIIPDAKLRAAIEAALGKAKGATITKGDMTTLVLLDASFAGIRDLTGLEFATNLRELYLHGNQITDVSALSGLTKLTNLLLHWNDLTVTDVSALSGLTNLTFLRLEGNQITDVSALSDLINLTGLGLVDNNLTDISTVRRLTKLRSLWLLYNNISDISVLSGLTNLEDLRLGVNNISNISSLSGLTNLTELDLSGNQITDISALSGLTNLTRLKFEFNNFTDISALSDLTNLTWLDLRGTPLNVSSINDHIPALQARGVTVGFDPPFQEGDFDIELVFLDDHFTGKQKQVIRYAARRWMSIIREDLTDYEFTQGWSDWCGDQSYEIPPGEWIDDLRIYVKGGDLAAAGLGGISVLRKTDLPVTGCVQFDVKWSKLESLGGFLETGLHEIGHVLGIGTLWDNFIQKPSGDTHFNGPRAIAAFDDAGGRDYAGAKVPVEMDGAHWRDSVLGGEIMQAVSYGAGNALSAITLQALADLGWVVDVTQADPYTLPRADDMEEEMQPVVDVAQADPYAAKASAKIAAPSTHAHGEQREPIYVVDPQGRIVRTISP